MSSTAFVSNTQFLTRYDSRTVAQLVSDTGTPAGSLSTDANLQQALEDATGEILMSALKGGRYSEADLLALLVADGSGNISRTGNYLQRLTCDLAFYYLVLRRGNDVDEYPQAEKAAKQLEALERGEKVFGVQDAIDAGVAQSPAISIQTIENENYIQENIRYFPTRRWTTEQF